jgi:hypothetical protein
VTPWAVIWGDGLALRVVDGVAGPDGAAEREGVDVGPAAGTVEDEAGVRVVEAGDAGGVFPEACGGWRWLASSAAAPATTRTQATMTASCSRPGGMCMAG